MKSVVVFSFFVLFFGHQVVAQPAGYLSNQEVIQKQREQSKQESALQDSVAKPNEKSTPVDTSKVLQGIDSDTQLEIKNHLLGYSAILDSGNTLQGIKFTGLINIAYYKSQLKSETGRSQGRFVFGLEAQLFELHNRVQVFGGFGGTLGDKTGLYVDAGLDLYAFSWFKVQAGLNWNSATSVAPQLSAGFVW